LDDQALDGLVLQLAETRMRPADDACGHFRSPYLATSVARLRRLSSPIYCSIMNVCHPVSEVRGGFSGAVSSSLQRKTDDGSSHGICRRDLDSCDKHRNDGLHVKQ